jgi:LacI family transcriptional regulator
MNVKFNLLINLKRFSFVFMPNKKVTIADIAKEVGVSKTLVSLVLNHKGDANSISRDTQKKVFDKARELNYIPNPMARSLRTGTTHTLGLIVADISNPFYGRITRQIEQYADNEGYSLMVCSSDEDPVRESRLIQMLNDRQVDGIIVASTLDDPSRLQKLKDQQIPLVLFDRYFDGQDFSYVGVDNSEATRKALSLLHRKGHKDIGFITLTPSHISSLKDRRNAYSKFVRERSEYSNPLLLELNYKELKEKNYNRIKDFIISNPDITALFTSNNSLAIGCINVIREIGLQIPKDISLISFDDIELFHYLSPSISSIAQPLEEIGEQAVALLLEQIKNKNTETKQIILDTNLIIRES